MNCILGKTEKREEAGCAQCFFNPWLRKVGSRGPEDSQFVIVGESPGINEYNQGIPFIGPAGELLEGVLADHNITAEETPYVTNAIKCLPTKQKSSELLAEAVMQCNGHLWEELASHPRRVILALGSPALWAVTKNYGLRITSQRGKVFKSSLADVGIVAAVHPAYLLRGGGNLKQFREDIALAVKLLREGPAVPIGEPEYEILSTPEQVRDLARQLHELPRTGVIASDIETDGFSFIRDRMLSSGFQFRPGYVYIVPADLLTPELLTAKARYIWHNGKFDTKFHRIRGEPARCDEDTMLMSYSLNERRGIHDLDQCALDKLNIEPHKDMLAPYLPKKSTPFSAIPFPVLARYQAKDIDKTFRLYHFYKQRIEADPPTSRLYNNLLMPASKFLTQVEERGIDVDLPYTEKNHTWLEERMKEREDVIREISQEVQGCDINVRSPQQVKKLLYETLKLAPISWSTDEDSLKRVVERQRGVVHPAIENLMRYRTLKHGDSHFVLPVMRHLESDGRIHSTYLLHGTATGRLSSRNPNLQNIPRDPQYRGQFVSGRDHVFIEPDLSQAELRSLACLSGDKALLEIFWDAKRSLHDDLATTLFGENFDEEQKMIAKNINFGIVYGITAAGLHDQLLTAEPPVRNITKIQCGQWLAGWADRFPTAWDFIQKCRQSVRNGQTITTCFGRKKRHGVVSPERLHNLENEASNFPHQAIASDIVLTASLEVNDYIWRMWDAQICNLVHDSNLTRVPQIEENVRETAKCIMNKFTEVPKRMGLNAVPFKSECKIGIRWGSAKAVRTDPKKLSDGTFFPAHPQWVTDVKHEFMRGWDPEKDALPKFALNLPS